MNTSRSINRRFQLLSITPLLIGLLAVILFPSVRNSLSDGIHLLVSGDAQGLQQWGATLGMWAPLATLVLMICQAIAAPIPAILVTATNALLFGPFWGGLYSVFTANIAAAICYGLARGFGADLVDRWIPVKRENNVRHYLQTNGFTTVLVARLVPFVPFDPISFLAGLTKMRFWPFFWATMLGQLPAGMAYSYLVSHSMSPDMGLVYSLMTVAALLVLGFILHRNFRPSRKTDRNDGAVDDSKPQDEHAQNLDAAQQNEE